MRRLCIVGVGLIGGSIGLAVKARGLPYHVVGVESNAQTWGDALRLGAVDEITNDLAAGVKGADLVILAVPVGAILELLPKLAPLVGENTVVTDTGSVKTAIAEAGFAHLGDRFVPGHPMAGSEKGGVLAARADLFVGATWAITPRIRKVGTFAAFIRSLG
ncbi:MAG: prephenate dehydrogenase/arogenate dehydrogenase family protein, partial [Armatimonadetes bacterium]|nr:prephenate dehydrogenase/arogenate dehydrogenase family protein [Armatimonadota bacterium]